MTQRFSNNASSTLAVAVDADDTSLVLTNAATFPTLTGVDYFTATLVDYDTSGNENAWEVVTCTARSGNTLTVTRGAEGTTARSWPIGTRTEVRLTAGALEAIQDVPVDPFHEICHIAGMQPTLYLDFARQDFRHYSPATGLREKALSDIVTFTRASEATYFDAKGMLQTAGSNVPRLDFDPATGACKGLLIEEARTNVFLNSLLDGTNLSTQTVTVTAAPWTISFYGAGSITLSGAHSATITGTSDTTRTTLTFTPTAGSLTCTVSGTVKWANCELGAFATSFIPTAGATATRAADVAVISGTPFSDLYRASAMSALIRASRIGMTTEQARALSLSDGTTSNAIEIAVTGMIKPIGYVTTGGVSQAALVGLIDGSLNAVRTFGFGATANDVVLVSDGAVDAVDSSSSHPTTITQVNLGNTAASKRTLCGHLRRVALWPSRLPNATLQQLTA